MGRGVLRTHVDDYPVLGIDLIVVEVIVIDTATELLCQTRFGLIRTYLLGTLIGRLELRFLASGDPDINGLACFGGLLVSHLS